MLVPTDNSTVVAYINKQGGTHTVEMRALLWKIMTWCHHYQITLRARHFPGCLNVMANLLFRSTQVQSTEWSLHPQVFKQICQKLFTPHVDLFTTHLNHKISLYVSPVPSQHRCSKHKLVRSHCLYLPPNGSQGDPKHQAIPDHCNSLRLARDALVLGPVQLSLVIPLHLQCQQHFSNSPTTNCFKAIYSISTSTPGVSEWTALYETGRENCCPSKVINKDHLQVKVGPIWEMVQKKFCGFLHSLCETSLRLFIYLYQDQNRRPSTIDGYRMVFVDTLGLAFTRIFPQVPGISQSGTFLFLNELTNRPLSPWPRPQTSYT